MMLNGYRQAVVDRVVAEVLSKTGDYYVKEVISAYDKWVADAVVVALAGRIRTDAAK